jgi:pimeloyl-ACP methyl ester carboxylesterase
VERKWVQRLGGGKRTPDADPFSLLGRVSSTSSTTISFGDALDWLPGPYFSLKHLWQELQGVNLFRQAPTLDVPVYFLAGRHDYYTPSLIVQRYYHALSASKGKTLIWFENSAHAPPAEDPDKFYDILVNTVLKETAP